MRPANPSGALTQLAHLAPGVHTTVVAIVVGAYPVEATRHDPKSGVLLTDPSLAPSSVKLTLFLRRHEDHPRLPRMGDILVARRVRGDVFQGRAAVTLSHNEGASYVLVDGNRGASTAGISAAEELDRIGELREWRAAQAGEAWMQALNCSGAFVAQGYPVRPQPAANEVQQQQQQHQQQQQNQEQPAAELATATLYSKLRQAEVKMRRRVALNAVEMPAADAAYFTDLQVVRITQAGGVGAARLFVNLSDGTGVNLQASCWGSEKCAEISGAMASGNGTAYAEVDNVRVSRDRMRAGQLEIKINEGSALRFLDANDADVVRAMGSPVPVQGQQPQQPQQQQQQQHKQQPQQQQPARQQTGQQGSWKCSTCGFVNFPSRRVCHRPTGCRKAYEAGVDTILHEAPPTTAPNGPPPWPDEEEPVAPAVPVKRARVDLTEVLTTNMGEEMMVADSSGALEPRLTRLVDVMACAEVNWRWLTEGRVVHARPLDVRQWTRPCCPQCDHVFDPRPDEEPEGGWAQRRPSRKDDVVAKCGRCGIDTAFADLKWRFFVQFEIRDGNVTLPVLVCGEHGALFFRSVPATDLWSNHASAQVLREKLDRLVASGQHTRFALMSYVPMHGGSRVFQCFDTVLL